MRKLKLSLALFFALAASAWCTDEGLNRCPETPCEGHLRAGCPQVVSSHSRPSDMPAYCGYYVGGGAAVHGQQRFPIEGTWGWDYFGLLPKRVDLNWWHGAHAQGGGGSYATDHR
jgi:hypothetical protein